MMRIGELARRAGVPTSTLRYYEEQGLLVPAAREDSGYRVYDCGALGRIAFIRRAKSLGLSLGEIRRLVRESSDPYADQAHLRHTIAHKLADTRSRIAELETLRRELEALYVRLDRGLPPCGHIGDCEYWLPTEEEVNRMDAAVRQAEGCTCCGCPCPDDGTCDCCDCPNPRC